MVANGGGLEESLVDLLATVAGDGVAGGRRSPTMSNVSTATRTSGRTRRRVIAAPSTRSSRRSSPAGATRTEIGDCTDAYRAELDALDTEIGDQLAGIPPERRVLVTNHDAFGYFADRYGFEIIGTVIPSAEHARRVECRSAGRTRRRDRPQHDVPAIFAERLGSATDAEALADRLGVDGRRARQRLARARRSGVDLHRHDARQRGGDRGALLS